MLCSPAAIRRNGVQFCEKLYVKTIIPQFPSNGLALTELANQGRKNRFRKAVSANTMQRENHMGKPYKLGA
jgi:hypothetical protein